MPKMKTHKGSKKRMKVTGRGKLMRRKAGTSHLMSRMSKKRKRKLRKPDTSDNKISKTYVKLLLGG